ncbi:hypothetical protein Tco_0640023 [Tanacetum coccineum]
MSGCTLWRKKLKEVWFTICHENGIYQDLLNTYEPFDDDTNVVNAPREPFVVKQDPGENFLQKPPQINHNCCYEYGDSLDDIFCQRCTFWQQNNVIFGLVPTSCGSNVYVGLFNCTFDMEQQSIFQLRTLLHPPQLQFETYLCELCGNNAHYGYDCPPQFPLVYEQEPCYNQNFNDNYFPQNSQSSSQQYLCCENCGGPHETFQCQPMNEDYYEQNSCYDPNSFGFDQYQPPQFPVNYPPQETSREILQAQEDLMEAIQAFLKEYDHIPPNEKCMALLLAEERFLKIKQVMREEQNQPEVMQELLLKLMDDLQILKGSQQEKKETTAQSFIPYWNSSMIDDEEARDNFLKDVCTFLRKFSRIPFGVTPKVILIAWESFGEIKDALIDKQYRQEDIQELMSKLFEDVRSISEEFLEYINYPSWNRPLFYFDDDDEEYTVIWRRPKAITPDKLFEEPENPLIIGEKELSTIPKKDKSSVEDLIPIPSRSKGVSDDINDHSDAKSLLSQDIPITSPKIDFLSEKFVGEFALILQKMKENEFDEEKYDSLENEDQEEKEFNLEDIFQIKDVILREKLLNVHRLITNIESLKNNPTPDFLFKFPSSFPIPVVDSDSFFEESDTSLSHLDNSLPEFETFSDPTEETRSGSTTTHANNSLPEYDSFLFEIEPDQGGLTGVVIYDNSNDPLLELSEFESFHFDLDPSSPRPPPEPPDVCLNFKPDTAIKNNEDFNKGEIVLSLNVEDVNSFTFVIWTFLPFFTYPEDSPVILSLRIEDLVFDPGIFIFHFYLEPVVFSMEVSYSKYCSP